mmetsp:Transcript_14422/g.31224  ORF Transcript_14422/g.31224 Transcript_14422/m.31224 type:complete len:104 (-) Transcript_14422:703-1014(-)|eukprot:CAMPEP_0202890366 /NCGR_PEP_ID=MMETSP1392-20130828/797_1 /ASSEMBLY_ACC=CAM_ASM_000868 /TAXON_ID=225041 /ORGANISM="Chlamydomonas chlamydogama, Strain SAG 11-48b" /LENGTH=103 /DNA_ID=CAMNT_0049573921 /DNA_START=165 /DNA_END=476 /DNA_ORIENTATION=+
MRDSHAFVDDDISLSGHVFLLKWLYEKWGDESTKAVVFQFLIFYVLMLIGFVFLYLMIKSTGQVRSKLKEIRRNVVEALDAESHRKWDLDDYNKAMAGGVGFM